MGYFTLHCLSDTLSVFFDEVNFGVEVTSLLSDQTIIFAYNISPIKLTLLVAGLKISVKWHVLLENGLFWFKK